MSFCCRALDSCAFRACRGCLLGDLKAQKRLLGEARCADNVAEVGDLAGDEEKPG